LEALSIAKIKDDTLFLKISKNIEGALQIYEKDIPDIIYYYG